MQEKNRITKESYVITKLGNEIGFLKGQLAEAEFTVLLLKQEVDNLKAENEKLKQEIDDASSAEE